MEFGTKVKILPKPENPMPFPYAGAIAEVKQTFTDMRYYAGMEHFLCLEILEAQDAALAGKTIFLHISQVEPC